MACNNGVYSNGSTGGLVAGLVDSGSTCYGPPFLRQKVASFRGVPVCVCTEDKNCYFGEIMEVCADYLTLNWYGTALVIPLGQLTQVTLAEVGCDGYANRL